MKYRQIFYLIRTIKHHRSEPELLLLLLTMNGCSLVLGLKHNPDFKWNSSIRYIARGAGKMVGYLNYASKFLISRAIIYLKKSLIRSKWSTALVFKETGQFLPRVQKPLRVLVGERLFGALQLPSPCLGLNVVNLSICRYFHGYIL